MKATKTVIHDLKEERGELKYKIKKLSRFKKSKQWPNISIEQQKLLEYQYDVMRCYRNILTARINNLKGDENE